MPEDRAIIHPVKGKTSPDPGHLAVLVSTAADLNVLCQAVEVDPRVSHRLFTSRMHTGFDTRQRPFSLIGPIIGAPYAVMLLETLIVWGARQFIYFGWCGTLAAEVSIGDVVLPTAAAIDEGTSRHYLHEPTGYSRPAPPVAGEIRRACRDTKHRFHEGPVWSTDAIFRETRDKVSHYQDQGVLAVEMELSALFYSGQVPRRGGRRDIGCFRRAHNVDVASRV